MRILCQIDGPCRASKLFSVHANNSEQMTRLIILVDNRIILSGYFALFF